jgi:hypothetical protein
MFVRRSPDFLGNHDGMQPKFRSVSLAEYFGGRAGLVTKWPASKYTRRDALLVNPEAAEPRIPKLFLWRGGATPSGGVATFENATIFGGGTIGVSHGCFVAESAYVSMTERARNYPGENHVNECINSVFERVVFIGREVQARNYGHCLVEVLPRLMLCGDALPDDVPLLINRSGDPHVS